jgi:hypothetical protein
MVTSHESLQAGRSSLSEYRSQLNVSVELPHSL